MNPTWPDAPSEYSIGILTGPSPFDITGSVNRIRNPVLTASDIPEFAAAYAADPFLIRKNDRWYLFYELLRASPRRGCIAWAESDDGLNWTHRGIAIDEPFHLSYPLVFEHEGRIFILPESNEIGSVRLYEATDFPGNWRHVTNLFAGNFADPTIIRHDGYWWIFASDMANQNLFLFYSDQLESGWREHPRSPVVRNDIQRARPGGRMIHHDGKVWRMAQNCFPRYGTDIRHYEVTKLTTTEYVEQEAGEFPLIKAGMFSWAELGMHHYDPQPYLAGDEKWMVAVDGNVRAQPEINLKVQFIDGSLLLGATRRPERIRAGDTMLLRLYWKNLPSEDRAIAFIHFVIDDHIAFQADHQLNDLRDHYDLFIPIPQDTPPGKLKVWIGLHREEQGRVAVRSPYRQDHHAVLLPFDMEVIQP